MRPLLVAAAFAALPAMAMAQSTVGNVPSDPNAMPAVNGSSAPPVAHGAHTAPTGGDQAGAASKSKSKRTMVKKQTRTTTTRQTTTNPQ